MEISKEELVVCIERARKKLDGSIANKDDYRYIYENSIALDRLLEIYISNINEKILNKGLTSIPEGCPQKKCGYPSFFDENSWIFQSFLLKKTCYFLTHVLNLEYKWWKVAQSGLKWYKSGICGRQMTG